MKRRTRKPTTGGRERGQSDENACVLAVNLACGAVSCWRTRGCVLRVPVMTVPEHARLMQPWVGRDLLGGRWEAVVERRRGADRESDSPPAFPDDTTHSYQSDSAGSELPARAVGGAAGEVGLVGDRPVE